MGPSILGVFQLSSSSWGYPQARWMVFVREDAIQMDDDWGYPFFLGNPQRVDKGFIDG